MPWTTPDLVTIREEFAKQAMSGRYPVAALCNAYGISEKTGHKRLNRFKEEGRPGLSDRSRAPHETPHKISPEVRREILVLREKHPTWGPKKLRVVLSRRVPEKHWPAASSIGELLRREGCVRPQRRRNTGAELPIDAGLTVARGPNDVWSTDFKGQFRLGIRPERIEPGEPQQNGKHERMHKTLKADATRPPSSSLTEQQLRFDRFRREYNDERPHESLGQETPASRYSPSARAFPSCLPELVYPAHFEARAVSSSGAINFRASKISIDHGFDESGSRS